MGHLPHGIACPTASPAHGTACPTASPAPRHHPPDSITCSTASPSHGHPLRLPPQPGLGLRLCPRLAGAPSPPGAAPPQPARQRRRTRPGALSAGGAPPRQTLRLAYKKPGCPCPPVPPQQGCHGELPPARRHQHAALRQERGRDPGPRLRPPRHRWRAARARPAGLRALVPLQHPLLQPLLPGLHRTRLLRQGEGNSPSARHPLPALPGLPDLPCPTPAHPVPPHQTPPCPTPPNLTLSHPSSHCPILPRAAPNSPVPTCLPMLLP